MEVYLSEEVLKSLSLTLKREKEMDQAASIWTEMISFERDRELFPYEELAKFYENAARSLVYDLGSREEFDEDEDDELEEEEYLEEYEEE